MCKNGDKYETDTQVIQNLVLGFLCSFLCDNRQLALIAHQSTGLKALEEELKVIKNSACEVLFMM